MQIARPHAAEGARDNRHGVQLGGHVRAGHEGVELGVGEDDALAPVDMGALGYPDALGRVLGDHFVAPEVVQQSDPCPVGRPPCWPRWPWRSRVRIPEALEQPFRNYLNTRPEST